MGTRTRNKLMEKSTWFKRKRIPEGESSEGEMNCKIQRVVETHRREKSGPEEGLKTKTVLFVPFTKDRKLAKELREVESHLGTMTGYKQKVVERSGLQLTNTLSKSNHWSGQDC